MISIFHRLYGWVSKNPEKLLFSFIDINGDQIQSYSYEQFIHRVEVISSNIHSDYQFTKDDRVLLAFPPGLEIICAFFACTRLGLIPVPIYPPTSNNFQSSYYKASYIASDSQAVAILSNREYHQSFRSSIAKNGSSKPNSGSDPISKLKWINTEEFIGIGKNDIPINYSETLFLQYTSGSTSDPKGVMVTHKNLLHNCDVVFDHFSPIGITWLPQYHDMGLIGYYLFSALQGGTTYGFSPTDFILRPSLWMEAISKYKGTASSAPNFAYDYCLYPGRILQETLNGLDLSSLAYLMTAAEPVRASTYLRFFEFFEPYGLRPKSFVAAYGLAENTLAVSNYGRNILSVDKDSLKLNKLKIATPEIELKSITQIVSCGKPLGDIEVKIVDLENHNELEQGNVGEIWIGGQSKCLGYWNKPELSKTIFEAKIAGQGLNGHTYLRTGDIGFLYEEEIYICGRAKDMLIIRGLNFFPNDIEIIVEESSDLVRKGCVVAFDLKDDEGEKLVVVVGVKNKRDLPDPVKISEAIKVNLNIQPQVVVFVLAKAINRTSSGKKIRYLIKQSWLDGALHNSQYFVSQINLGENKPDINICGILEELKQQYRISGNETTSVVNTLDSLDLAILTHDIHEYLKINGGDELVKLIDIGLIQSITVSELFKLIDLLKTFSLEEVFKIKSLLICFQNEHNLYERNMMINDIRLSFIPKVPCYAFKTNSTNVFLTSGTGFLGPFILKSLLQQTDQRIYVLVRANDYSHGKERLRLAIDSIEPLTTELIDRFEHYVIPICGDLEKPQLGLNKEIWSFLANNIQCIYHNGAAVNYLFNYEKMRLTNVTGTNEILKLAFDGNTKVFNHISTTFIFGWATKDILYEGDSNEDMALLDFGYSQSKWVSEQIVFDAKAQGLKTRIFRPALITPSIGGDGNNFDISIRLLAFMINHGIGVDAHNQVSFTPADVVADNIVAISNIPETVDLTFHVTRDHYANMIDVINIIRQQTGQEFQIFKLPEFVKEVIKRCTPSDLLFPLLDFLVNSVHNISGMEFKRYDSRNYQTARSKTNRGRSDPSLEETVGGMLRYMRRHDLINV